MWVAYIIGEAMDEKSRLWFSGYSLCSKKGTRSWGLRLRSGWSSKDSWNLGVVTRRVSESAALTEMALEPQNAAEVAGVEPEALVEMVVGREPTPH